MSDRDDLLAILKGHVSEIEALIGVAGSISLSCFDLKAQGDSGLEVRRLLYAYAQIACATEMRLIDFNRGYADIQPMSEVERSQYRANRSDDLGDITHEAYEKINEYAQGMAA